MTSKELSDSLLNIDDDTKVRIIESLPIGVRDAAQKLAESYKTDIDDDIVEYLEGMFILGYIAAKAEQRLILEEAFIK